MYYSPAMSDARRSLPAVHQLVTDALIQQFGQQRVAAAARMVIEQARAAAGRGVPSDQMLREQVRMLLEAHLEPAINATGVVLHTNLGRAPWSANAKAAAERAMGYCSVELDCGSGRRGRRGAEAEERLCALTGAQAALVVNNCAAAVMLALRVLAKDKRVLVSRGELVEIGGGFRVPDVLAECGAILAEVGTTNRTHVRDYEAALGADVGAILRVHHSNFLQLGFVASVTVEDLSRLGPPVVVDAGSGAFFDVGGEPMVPDQLAAGASLVCFSGDKLLGGPQAGIVVGNGELIERLRAQPLFRALRPDKVTLAALEATLDDWLRGNAAPVRAMIDTPLQTLRTAVAQWREALPAQVDAEIVEVEGAIGGGSVPGRTWPSVALGIRSPKPEILRRALLAQTPSIVSRIHHDTLLLDARTVVPLGLSDQLLRGLLSALDSVGAPSS